MNNESIEEKPLFEIPDYVYISGLIGYAPMFIIIFIWGIIELGRGNPLNLHVNLMIGVSISILLFLFVNIKKTLNDEKRKIKFFEDKILKTSNNKYLLIEDIEETICISNLFASPTLDGVNPKLRLENHNKISKLLYMPFLSIIIILFTIPMVLLNIFIYRYLILTSQLTILKWKDTESIPILYPLPKKDEQKKVKEYFKKYLNIDVNQIKTNYL